MEQHNIDKHFKEGLGNISRQPSADAWARLQAQMEPVPVQEEKKQNGFWLYIAAAITLLLVSVATWQFGFNTNPSGPQLAATQSPVKDKSLNRETTKQTSELVQPEKMAAQNASQIAAKTDKPAENSAQEAKLPAVIKENRQQARTENMFAARPEPKQIAAVKPSAKTTAALAEKTAVALPQPATKEETDQPVMLAATKPAAAPDQHIIDLNGKPIEVIVKRSAPQPAPQALAANNTTAQPEERDQVKLKDIFKQARNLKNGESVNLEDLGLQANSKLAMETRNLHQKFSKVIDL